MRAVSRMMGAATPMAAAPGVKAITSEPKHISETEAIIAFLRP